MGEIRVIRLNAKEFDEIVTYIREHYGINLEKKQVLIECRLAIDTVRDGGRDHLGRHFAAFRRDVSLYFRLPTARRTQTYEIEYSLFFSANPGSGRDFSFRTTPFPKNIAFAVQPPVRTRKIRSAKSGIVLDPLFQWEN